MEEFSLNEDVKASSRGPSIMRYKVAIIILLIVLMIAGVAVGLILGLRPSDSDYLDFGQTLDSKTADKFMSLPPSTQAKALLEMNDDDLEKYVQYIPTENIDEVGKYLCGLSRKTSFDLWSFIQKTLIVT